MVSTIDLIGFVDKLRQDFFECAAKLGWKEFTKDRGVSMLSFRDIFLHLALRRGATCDPAVRTALSIGCPR